ncbi:uncharacterized protein BX664DRAFT_322111 [Halteromyces radiatus]|uniref:uncharacterized protein n=1 Tax=Halteromyces radiatus TaxID=101107 RepID=UPI00221E3B38|nr:uncharacterized protein BX664DRAFT_322111 [Halteromyces radiatus]KAI8099784.1 hypothetical protein BX664DRAFT_322111 [Halteromyces radiatus]
MNKQPLFGGSIYTIIKSSYIDASNLRQVPDNQEVFLDMRTNQSLIIELLEKVEHLNEEAAKFHFEQIAEHNNATSYSIKGVEHVSIDVAAPKLPLDTTVYFVRGIQNVAKFNEDAVNHVELVMAVVRLEKVQTDLIISLNAPIQLAPNSSEMHDINQIEPIAPVALIIEEVKQIVQALEIHDWGLFGV